MPFLHVFWDNFFTFFYLCTFSLSISVLFCKNLHFLHIFAHFFLRAAAHSLSLDCCEMVPFLVRVAVLCLCIQQESDADEDMQLEDMLRYSSIKEVASLMRSEKLAKHLEVCHGTPHLRSANSSENASLVCPTQFFVYQVQIKWMARGDRIFQCCSGFHSALTVLWQVLFFTFVYLPFQKLESVSMDEGDARRGLSPEEYDLIVESNSLVAEVCCVGLHISNNATYHTLPSAVASRF